jgi:hypothetical protein
MRHLTPIIAVVWLCGCNPSESLSNLSQGEFAVTPDTVTIKIKGYRPQTGKIFQNLFVSNYSVKVKQGQLYYSTSRDSMADVVKKSLVSTYGFNTTGPETVVTGFADLVLFQAGINLGEQSMIFCASNLLTSSSNDALIYNDSRLSGNPVAFLGLRDCDKVYMGMNPQKFDFNGNGIPDYIEMQCGMNPLSTSDAFVSTAGDGVANIDKCKRHVPIDEYYYTQPNQAFAYQYNVQVNQDGSSDFTVMNIPILNGGADNFISFYVTETDSQNGAPGLYTAFSILKPGYTGKTLEFPYWATAPSNFFNQEIIAP